MKYFNITGLCIPHKHYMVDIANKLAQIEKMVDRGDYFTINRGRQYGKTTTLFALEKMLISKYLVLSTSFEGIGDTPFENQKSFNKTFIALLHKELLRKKVSPNILQFWNNNGCDEINDLSRKITELCELCSACNLEVVLMIDEVDKSSNNQLFLNFLGMLRNKYLEADKGADTTFKSVILAGVYDVKNLKLKLRPDEEKKINSPWNIATEFKIDMSFNEIEIESILVNYESENHTGMNITEIATEIYKYTSGYPFLVSKLCKTIDEDLEKNWSLPGIQEAIKLLLVENNTLFDDLFKNLENNIDLYKFIIEIMLDGKKYPFDVSHPIINLASAFAIIKNQNQVVEISNLIFEVKTYNYLILKQEIGKNTDKEPAISGRFFDNVVKNNKLNMELLLTKFAEFMYTEHRDRDQKFIEREGRLLFLCFLKPIINGSGFYFVEPETRHDRRMDIVVTQGGEKFVVELKIWYGESKLAENYAQLADYLDAQKLDTGYLLTFNFNKNHENKTEWLECNGKKIFSVMVWPLNWNIGFYKMYNAVIIGAGQIAGGYDAPNDKPILTHAHAYQTHPA